MTVEEYFEEWWTPKKLPENGFNKTAMLDFAEMYHNKSLHRHDVMGSAFSENDKVHRDGKTGVVTRVSDKAVHVRYDDGYFQKFHFQPTHHMQTSITALKHYP